MMNRRLLLSVSLAVFLVACSDRAADPVPAPQDQVQVPADAPEPVPPEAPEAGDGSTGPVHNPEVFNFEGFGPAKFGADEEQVRMAWGHPLEAGAPSEGATCYYLTMDPSPPGGYGIAFMFEEGGFRRYDVDLPLHVAPGGLTTGMAGERVEAAFPGRVESMPHKYVEGGRYLVVAAQDGGDARLVFELDPEGTITEWRIGLVPQVLYVEGCS